MKIMQNISKEKKGKVNKRETKKEEEKNYNKG